MTAGDPFSGPEAAQIARVAEVIGTRLAAATALVAVDLCKDDSISPAALVAGLCRAHIAGLASAIVSAPDAFQITPAEVFDALRTELAKAAAR